MDILDLFTCPRMPGGLRLMPNACADYYRKGKQSEPWESTHVCRGCRIGAGHAGEQVVSLPEPHRCRACHAVSHRLILGLVCVSCYNRINEALKGANARGRPPRKVRPDVITPYGAPVLALGGVLYVGSAEGRLAHISRAPGHLPYTQGVLFAGAWGPDPCISRPRLAPPRGETSLGKPRSKKHSTGGETWSLPLDGIPESI